MTLDSSTANHPVERGVVNEDHGDAVCVVGDRFAGMASVPGVHTLSQLVGDLGRGGPVPRSIVAGQGLARYEFEYLQAAVARRNEDLRVQDPPTERVARSLVYKHHEQNVLLADLTRTAERSFSANLRIHGDNELLLDHQTGQHVQGIIVAETVRQMFIAVFEFEHGVRHPDRRYYVVWNSINLTFDTFLFPLPAVITCEILDQDVADVTRMSFRVAMTIEQMGRTAAHAEIEFASIDDDKVKRSELRKATSTVEALIAVSSPVPS